MPQFLANTNADNISDEEYLVLRSRETLQIDPYQCKAWTLTARTLFPQNFDIQVGLHRTL